MGLPADSKYKIYQPESLPPGLFGETYVVSVGMNTSGNYFKGECYVLTKRPKPNLYIKKWRFSATGVPPELVTIDVDFMLNEGRTFAENFLIDRLYEIAESKGNADLLGVRINLVECNARPFVGCWLRNEFHEQLIDLSQQTECESLSRYLDLVSQMKVFGPA